MYHQLCVIACLLFFWSLIVNVTCIKMCCYFRDTIFSDIAASQCRFLKIL